MTRTLLGQGAEAFVYLDGDVVKERVPKRYRHPVLDHQLRRSRLRREAKILEKLQGVVPVPKFLAVDEEQMTLHMENVSGKLLRLHLPSLSLGEAKKLFEQIGVSVSRMHALHVVHGDLTTSNMILHQNKVTLIDFGLAFISTKQEDMAVDLHLLRQALESAHYSVWKDLWLAFVKGYSSWQEAPAVFDRLEKVEKRGRYKRKNE